MISPIPRREGSPLVRRLPAFLAITLLMRVAPLGNIGAEARAGQWTGHGPEGGSIAALVTDAAGTIYAASFQGGGVFKSTDGATWHEINTGLSGNARYVYALAVDPSASTPTLYAGTNGDGVFKSTDGGATWFGTALGDFGRIVALAADPMGTIYAGLQSGGISKSTDGGASWADASSGLPFGTDVKALVIDPTGNLYAGTADGVFKSIDGGGSWTDASNGLPALAVLALKIDPASPTILYAGTNTSGVFKTTDGAENWAATDSTLTGAVFGFTIDAAGNLYAGTNNGVAKSSNGGTSWSFESTGLTSSQVFALLSDSTGDVYAGTTPAFNSNTGDGGVYKTADGGAHWSEINTGLQSQIIAAVAVDATRPGTVYAGASGVFKSPDSGDTWVHTNTGFSSNLIQALAVDPSGNIYAGDYLRGVFKSTDGGHSWSSVGNLGDVQALAIDPAGTIYAGTFGATVYKSTDSGGKWNSMSTGLPAGTVQSLVIDANSPPTIYAGLGGDPSSGGVYKSVNGGANWVAVNNGLPQMADVVALAVDVAGSLYAADRSGVYKSLDGGSNWTVTDVGLTAGTVALAVDPSPPHTVYAGSYSGVSWSTDGGGTWTPMTASPGMALTLAVEPGSPSRLHVGTHGGSVFEFQPDCGDGIHDPGEQCDDGALNGTSQSCCSTLCEVQPVDTACAGDGNPCSLDQCDGTHDACQHPAGNTGAVCYAGSGFCDPEQQCTGASTTCPAPTPASSTVVCRPAAGECDQAERCPGVAGAACPADAKQAAGTACTDDGNPCTTDTCDGTSDRCQHPAGNAGATCRPAVGDCDVAESCDGTSNNCPADRLQPDGTACNDGNACTYNDTCGSGQCVGTAITCTNDECNTRTCNGTSSCTVSPNTGAACNGGGTCDSSGTCVTSTPSPPTNITAAAGDGRATVTWLPPASDGGNPITGYTVTSSPVGSSVSVDGATTSASITGLTNGTAYTFTVVATNAVGTSDPSSPSDPVTPQPDSPPPVTATGSADPTSGGQASTGTDPTASQPLTTSVDVPQGTSGGDIAIAQTTIDQIPPSGYSFLGQQIDITAPAATPDNPLRLVFTLDPSLASGQTPDSIDLFRTEGGVTQGPIPGCTDPGAVPDPCVASRAYVNVTDIQIIVLTSHASAWNVGVVVTSTTTTQAPTTTTTTSSSTTTQPPTTMSTSTTTTTTTTTSTTRTKKSTTTTRPPTTTTSTTTPRTTSSTTTTTTPPTAALAPGYWKSHAAATTALLPQRLGGYKVSTFQQALDVFNAMDCSNSSAQNAVGCLAGQLLAAELNVANGSNTCINAAISQANAFLSLIGYKGPTGTYKLTSAQRGTAVSLATTLSTYNNGGPCG